MTCLKPEKGPPENFLAAIRTIAPGTVIREGIESVLRAKTGGLLVIGDKPEVRELAEGGFEINSPVTARKIYELAKMDGAIILDEKGENIWKANVQLAPQSGIFSEETGIRHRIAEKVARQTGAMVIAISQRRSLISVFRGPAKYVLPDVGLILTKANQAIQTLEKYRAVLERVLLSLNILEFEDVVTVLDICKVIQRVEMVARIVNELDYYLALLGSEGHLVNMQMEELMVNVKEEGHLVLLDYLDPEGNNFDQINKNLRSLGWEELLETTVISKILGFGNTFSALDHGLTPRGFRILNKLSRMPFGIIENLIKYFGSLQRILGASMDELDKVEGIGEVRAKGIKNGLIRLREQLLLDRHF